MAQTAMTRSSWLATVCGCAAAGCMEAGQSVLPQVLAADEPAGPAKQPSDAAGAAGDEADKSSGQEPAKAAAKKSKGKAVTEDSPDAPSEYNKLSEFES